MTNVLLFFRWRRQNLGRLVVRKRRERKQKRARDSDDDKARRINREQVHGVMARIAYWRDSGTKLFEELAEKTFFATTKTHQGSRAGKAVQDRKRSKKGQFAAYVEEGVMVDVSTSPNDKENVKNTKKQENEKKPKNIKEVDLLDKMITKVAQQPQQLTRCNIWPPR